MNAGTAFTATIDGINYQFVTISDRTASNSGNSVNFDSVDVYEGTYVIGKFIVDTSNPDQKFILTDPRADTTTLTVKVQTSTTDTSSITYTRATDITQLSASSTVYYLQEVDRGRFEVYFGDGVVSKNTRRWKHSSTAIRCDKQRCCKWSVYFFITNNY